MINVVKWPKITSNKKYVLLGFKQKCLNCKTVVEINSLNDLEYDGYVSYDGTDIFTMSDHEYRFNYTCPYCRRTQRISNKNISYVTRYIDIKNEDIHYHKRMYQLKEKPYIDRYDKFEAYWLSSKSGIVVPEKLTDPEIDNLFKNDKDLMDLITNDKCEFISKRHFEIFLGDLKYTNPEEYRIAVQSLIREERCTHFNKVGYTVDSEGRMNLCIDTNGPYCVLLVLGRDGYVIKQSLIPANEFESYEGRLDSSFRF